jgi:PhzF family phenazine biosynthesis protein
MNAGAVHRNFQSDAMRNYRLKHVDAFTIHPFAGNPAGVVLDARGLTDTEMQTIARENNLSETAFILPSTVKSADLQIRWFTPTHEVPLCGHATIASFHSLAEEGMEGMSTQGQHYFKLQTKSGILSVRVEKNFQGTTVEFQLPLPKFKVKKNLSSPLLHALGLRKTDLESKLPVVVDSYLYIPVKSRKTLEKLTPDFALLLKSSRQEKVLGVCLFTLETYDTSSSVHSRFFAPAVGINEDPVTGSSNGPLGMYLWQYAIARDIPVRSRQLADGKTEFIGEQGNEIGRAGHVKIRVVAIDGGVVGLSIAGEAVTIMNSILSF